MLQDSSKAERMEAIALVTLRLGLAWFLFVWAVNKLLAPVQYQKIWGYFHGIEIGATLPYIMGTAQIIICLAIAIGLWRKYSYALGFVMHAVTVAVILPGLLAPFVIENGFPTNRNQSIAVAALAGFAALWLLRHRDHWSLDVWLAKKNEHDISLS
ncbi:DoxX family membrane protein [Pelagibius sp. Alg239-R121]|uniref:DoxX family membrane protein n=1 Tax=Pelagibius sp. Alg239-R121 TaxID=2993448 RepID=UPI0024A60FB6|nr:DoxX family membrane protein [Pelagibius sp. Alg239-R121]